MDVIKEAINAHIDGLRDINRKIHDNPELGYEEVQAHDNIVAYLRSLGYKVTPHAYGVGTALEAEYGTGGCVVTFNAEYDALPGIGHACGHNLIATASIAAFIGAAVALKASQRPGRVRLLGTPAEEGGGGKLKLIDAGAFMDVAACMMVHPAPFGPQMEQTTGSAYMTSFANSKFTTTFRGAPAHAAMAPWDGRNALDAANLTYTAVGLLRQQTRSDARIHAVVTHGGDRPNVIPHRAALTVYVRAPALRDALALRARVEACARGAATATACAVTVADINTYFELRPSRALAAAYAGAMAAGGTTVALAIGDGDGDTVAPERVRFAGSTDQGNVSYVCPAIHPIFGIDAAEGSGNHTVGFAEAAGRESAFEKAVDTAKGMAAVAWRVWTDHSFAEAVVAEFESGKAEREAALRADSAAAVGEEAGDDAQTKSRKRTIDDVEGDEIARLKAEIVQRDEKIKKLEDELAELKDEGIGLHERESRIGGSEGMSKRHKVT